jgi:hypothetical protein
VSQRATVTLRLDRFGRDALDEYVRRGSASPALALRTAVRYYLNDSKSRRASWPMPALGRDTTPGEALEVELDEALHGRLEAEARRQDVAPDGLAVHALLYFLADYESGRAAARLGAALARDAEAN